MMTLLDMATEMMKLMTVYDYMGDGDRAKDFAERKILPLYLQMAEAMLTGAVLVPTVVDMYDEAQLLLMCAGLIPNNH